jgi:Fe-S-cluster containining protein
MSAPFYKEGLRFSCKQCSHCCRHEPGYVYLSENDLTNLLQWFNLKKEDFIANYCRVVPYYDGTEVLCLKEKKNCDCIFWDNGCKAYKARPVQCSTYPFWNFIIKNKDTWEEEATQCPGINSGELHNSQEIEIAMRLHRDNFPIRIK